ncbi:MAG: 30S ribosomal protein S3ae [Desulfurococcales archaeon ex4484_204]|nr:MAG: 30S ribosomal protein S3ae [Desulfurococcales archaeon ex4484_204]
MSRPVIKDKWKLKKWYTILAPPMFGSAPIGITPVDRDWKLMGRVFEVTLFDLTGDFAKHHIHLFFQVYEVKDDTAHTRFKGHELARDYMKSIIRRKSSKVQAIIDVQTKDGYGLRVTGIALTAFRCKASQKKLIRRVITRVLSESAKKLSLEEYVKSMVFGKLALEIMEQAKKVYPIRKVEIYKSKLLTIPSPEGPKPAVIIAQPHA